MSILFRLKPLRAPLCGLFVFLLFSVAAPSQGSIPGPDQEPPFGHPQERRDPDAEKRDKDMEKARNQERQKSLKKDTDQLLQLANELKQYVDKSNENMLSLDVIKKAEEIEKLAHKVKDKMRGS